MYTIVHQECIDPNVEFIRIQPNDLQATLQQILSSLADLSWINKFDQDYVRTSLTVRAQETVDYITKKVLAETDDKLTKDTGQYLVSELGRQSIIDVFKHSNIPLAELFKQQRGGNPGFDFFGENATTIVFFGEAKYNARQNAYGVTFEQIVRFESERRDHSDVFDIRDFCTPQSLQNVSNNIKGYAAAFSCGEMSNEDLIKNIKNNSDYKRLIAFKGLVCVAINI